MCQNVSMEKSWDEVMEILKSGKITYADVARTAGINEKTIRNLIKERHKPNLGSRILITRAVISLISSVSDTVRHNHKKQEPATTPSEPSPQETALLNLSRSLPDSQRALARKARADSDRLKTARLDPQPLNSIKAALDARGKA